MVNQELLKERILEELTPIDTYDAYCDALDDIHDDIDICGYIYAPSDVFRCVDPTAYRTERLNYLSEMRKNKIYYELYTEYYDYAEVQEIIKSIETGENEKEQK